MSISFLFRTLFAVLTYSFISCQNSQPNSIKDNNIVTDFHKVDTIEPSIQSIVFLNNDSIGGWGYDIILSNAKFIHQTNIPAIEGEKGFYSKSDAQKIADLVIHKIKFNSTSPPSISINELDSMNIKK